MPKPTRRQLANKHKAGIKKTKARLETANKKRTKARFNIVRAQIADGKAEQLYKQELKTIQKHCPHQWIINTSRNSVYGTPDFMKCLICGKM